MFKHSDHLEVSIHILFRLLKSRSVPQLRALRIVATEVEQHVAGIEVERAPSLPELQLLRLVRVHGVAVVDALQPSFDDALLERLLHDLPLLLGECAGIPMLQDHSSLVEIAGEQVVHGVPHHVDVQGLGKAIRWLREVDIVLVLDVHSASPGSRLLEEVSKTCFYIIRIYLHYQNAQNLLCRSL